MTLRPPPEELFPVRQKVSLREPGKFRQGAARRRRHQKRLPHSNIPVRLVPWRKDMQKAWTCSAPEFRLAFSLKQPARQSGQQPHPKLAA
jgi:hypothetical protein